MQLVAQIMYRNGDYAKAAQLFQQAETSGGSSSELSTNILAALVSAGEPQRAIEYAQAATGGASSDEGGTQFELYYNWACAAIWANQLRTARQLLRKAIDLCRETLSGDDYTEEEVEVGHGRRFDLVSE